MEKNLSAFCTGVNHFLTNACDNDKTNHAGQFLRNLAIGVAEARTASCFARLIMGDFQIRQGRWSSHTAFDNPAATFSGNRDEPVLHTVVELTRKPHQKDGNHCRSRCAVSNICQRTIGRDCRENRRFRAIRCFLQNRL